MYVGSSKSQTVDVDVVSTPLPKGGGILENEFERIGLPIIGVVCKLDIPLLRLIVLLVNNNGSLIF